MPIDVYKEWLGIPEAPRPPDHYQLLRLVPFEDDVEKIRANYKKLNGHVRKYASGEYSAESQELLNELAKAMLCLTDPQRKRELDESLGREFEDSGSTKGRTLGDVLVSSAKISKAQLKEAENFADARGLTMRDAVVQMKFVDAETAAQALAEELGRSYVDLSEMIPEDSVLDGVSRNLVKRNSILPLFIDDDVLLVAAIDEIPHELEEELRLTYEVPILPVIAAPRAIEQSIAKYYAPGMRDDATGSTTKKKSKSSGKASAKKPKKRKSQMNEEEKSQELMMQRLIWCWVIIGSVLVDQFVLGSIIGAENLIMGFLLTYLVAPAAGFMLWKTWQKD